MINNLTIRPEEHKDYKAIVSLILHSFSEGTDYSDGTDIIALVEEIRDSKYYIPELSVLQFFIAVARERLKEKLVSVCSSRHIRSILVLHHIL